MTFEPVHDPFFVLFEKLAASGVQAVSLFKEMLADYAERQRYFDRIFDTERAADVIVHEIIQRANQSYTTPIAREDVRALTSLLDDLVDLVEATADRMILYNIDSVRPELPPLVDILLQAAEEAAKAVGELQHLNRPEKLAEYCVKVNSIENEGDRVSRRALAALFATPNIDALEALKWREIYEHVEAAIDLCEDIGDLLEGVVIKRSS